jgi:hypothetical protein
MEPDPDTDIVIIYVVNASVVRNIEIINKEGINQDFVFLKAFRVFVTGKEYQQNGHPKQFVHLRSGI